MPGLARSGAKMMHPRVRIQLQIFVDAVLHALEALIPTGKAHIYDCTEFFQTTIFGFLTADILLVEERLRVARVVISGEAGES
jgi:hypothetical protein